MLSHFYPRSPCGERRAGSLLAAAELNISIHALLAESDHIHAPNRRPYRYFYPRSPCGERPWGAAPPSPPKAFLSTLSLRRATSAHQHQGRQNPISIHALLAESDRFRASLSAVLTISIHALLAESDFFNAVQIIIVIAFLSTLSLRRATGAIVQLQCILGDFYPRSPCGERQNPLKLAQASFIISIHALLAESDETSSRK